MKKSKKKFIIIGGIVVVLIVVTFFVVRSMGTSPQSQEAATVKQNVVPLSKMDLSTSISATGTLESASSKVVSANLNNIEIKKVKVEEGDEVAKGQVLVTFDESDLKDALKEARDSLSDTKAQNARELSSAQRKLADVKDTYSSQKSNYAKEVKEKKQAVATAREKVEVASGAEKEKAEEILEQAKEAYQQAKNEQKNGNKQNLSNIESAQDSLSSIKSSNKRSLREAQKSVESAKEALEECSITAPMSGTVTAVAVEDGDNYNGESMIEISDCTNLQVSTTVSEYDVASIKKGQKVAILTDATGEEELEGKITYVALTTGSSLSSLGEAGGMGSTTTSSSGYEVRIKVSNIDERLRIGMTAKCSIILTEKTDTFAVPYDAIHKKGKGENVIYVQDTQTGEQKEIAVTKGLESDYYVAIEGEGLEEGMLVLIPTDKTDASSATTKDSSEEGMFGNMTGGMPNGNMPSGNMPSGMGGRGNRGGGASGNIPGM